jgi:hypothetical protein
MNVLGGAGEDRVQGALDLGVESPATVIRDRDGEREEDRAGDRGDRA